MARKQRSRVLRSDGKLIHLVPRRGHVLVCAKGCCCGRTDRGHQAVPIEFYKQEYKRRKIRKQVQLSMSGCLGPCPLANVVLLFFDGRPVWLQSIHTEAQIVALFDYVDQMLAADSWLPPPPELAELVFDFYGWTGPPPLGAPPSPVRSEAVPAGFLLLSHADTDLLTLHHARSLLPADFPAVHGLSLSQRMTGEEVATLLDRPQTAARAIIVRLLGGAASVPGLARLVERARQRHVHLLVVSGTGIPDPELAALSTVAPNVLQETTAFLQMGGVDNLVQMLRFLSDHLLMTGLGHQPPLEQPQHGIYHPDLPRGATLDDWLARHDPDRPSAGLLFYRSHWMSGNLAFIDAWVRTLQARGANVLPVFTASLRETDNNGFGQRWPAAFALLCRHGKPVVDVLVSTMAFAMGEVQADGPTPSGWSVQALAALDVPVLQAICASTRRWQWEAAARGLNPLDTAMHVALPEFDGRIITVPTSFKEPRVEHKPQAPARGCSDPIACAPGLCDAVQYVPAADRIDRVAGLALRLARLRRKANADKRIAFILTNSPGKAARIGNAVGLDAPASLVHLLACLRDRGYRVEPLPANGDSLIHTLIDRGCYDEAFLTSAQLSQAVARVPIAQYQSWFDELPAAQRSRMAQQWGAPPGDAFVHDGHLALAGMELGHVFVALQPPRGFGMDPNAIYHQPDLPPPHPYYALYRWLRDVWGADAIVHVGKHGTLEWLPGKGVGLSADCFPDSFLHDLPLIYPFILNDPGEGAQAKRRGHAIIVDHLTPPLTTAGSYGELAQLMQLVDEYYQVELLDPAKLPLVQQQIWALIQKANLQDDLRCMFRESHGDHVHDWDDTLTAEGTPVTLAQMRGRDMAHLIEELDGYLCQLAGAQIRDGLHVLGQVPAGTQMVDLLHALTRLPNLDVPSLPAALARCFGLAIEPLLEHPGERLAAVPPLLTQLADRPLATGGDVHEALDELARHLLALLHEGDFAAEAIDRAIRRTLAMGASSLPSSLSAAALAEVRSVLHFVCTRLAPVLRQTTDEIDNLLAALEGRYVPAGPSGAPTRGLAHVLPTGRNFYAVDPRALPSAAAWQVGQELAREVLERFRGQTGAYPESVGISLWGTSAMRTHGDDVAEVLAFLGVRPVWQKESRRVAGCEVIPLAELGRPRIDVTLRISGFFRDAFPHLIRLVDEAVQAIIARDEPPEQNFIRKHYLADVAAAIAAGQPDAERRARYRIFGSPPGAYGAGLLSLIDERNWHSDADLAQTYVNWGGHAYTADEAGVDARDVFQQRLAGVQVALHNQDNREHDILDSDDYFQFHGGMIATIRALTGRQPHHYFGATDNPARPVVRDLQEEVLRVFRSRVVNPKWLESICRHGYKGGLELAATVDYLFGYDATAGVVSDWMYEQVAERYALDPSMRQFLGQSNPWALQAIGERLLEAAERGLWQAARPETLQALRQAVDDSDRLLEARGERD